MLRLLLSVSFIIAIYAQTLPRLQTFDRRHVGDRAIYFDRQSTTETTELEQHLVRFHWLSTEDRFTALLVETNQDYLTTFFSRFLDGPLEGREFILEISYIGTEPLIVNLIAYGFKNEPLEMNDRRAVGEMITTKETLF